LFSTLTGCCEKVPIIKQNRTAAPQVGNIEKKHKENKFNADETMQKSQQQNPKHRLAALQIEILEIKRCKMKNSRRDDVKLSRKQHGVG